MVGRALSLCGNLWPSELTSPTRMDCLPPDLPISIDLKAMAQPIFWQKRCSDKTVSAHLILGFLSGDILLVGSNKADPNGTTDAGAAYLHRLESNDALTFLSKIHPSDALLFRQQGFPI